MSLYLQIAIPLLAAFITLVVIAIVRKYIKLETVVISAVVLCMGVYMTVMHFSAPDKVETEGLSETDVLSLMVAEECMLSGQYDDALEILNQLQKENSGDEQVALNIARCSLLKGNYSAASKYYQQLNNVDSEEKEEALALYNSSKKNDNAIVKYLSSSNLDPAEYGISSTPVVSGDLFKVSTLIADSVEGHLKECKDNYGNEMSDAAKYSALVNKGFNDYLSNNYTEYNEDDVSDSLDSLIECIESKPSIAENEHIRESRLKGHIIFEDYDDIAAEADKNSTEEELLVLADLYTKELIDEDDFSDSYSMIDEASLEQMLDLCREGLEKHKDSIPAEKYDEYMDDLDVIAKQIESPALFTLRYNVLSAAQNGDIALSSKSYMALAKIEHYSGNDELVDAYLSDALGTADSSDDENYRIPMNNIVSILEGTSKDVKNIAQYVDDALNNSLPEKIETSADSTTGVDGLKDHLTDTISQSTATINIGIINKDNFPEVKARIQVQSDLYSTIDELYENLKVYDCGSEITDFQLEKLEFQSSHILLLCDVSGSMSGNEESLRQAIISFADNMTAGEWVSVVGFDSEIDFVHEFSDDPNVVKGYADSIYASGGTALFSSLVEVGDYFTYDINSNNIIIAMTDGQDGDYATEQEMYNAIGGMAADKNIIVYTLGLGYSVDEAYLRMIAECGNGSFLYVDSDESLESFYTFIHGQLSNQYILTYTAKNQTLNERKLELAIDAAIGGKAEKTYYLIDPEHTNTDEDSYNPYTVVDTDISVSGLATKFLYKSSQNQTILLKGEGFDVGDDVSARITGNVKYNLEISYKDANTYEIIIPSKIAIGTYDLTISIRGNGITMNDELTVAAQGTEKSFRYGSYSFTSLNSYVNSSGYTVLSGNVVMNGWLYFKGDVTISSSYYDTAKVWVTDNSGAYVSYSTSTAEGLARYMAERGVSLSLGVLGEFCIYNTEYSPDDYETFDVEEIELTSADTMLFFIERAKMYVYPDMVQIQGGNYHFELPFQKQIMRGLDIDTYGTAHFDSKMLLNATKICMIGSYEYSGEGDDSCFTMVSLPLTFDSLSVKVDTLKNDYEIGAGVKLKALKNMDGLEFKFGVKSGRFDSLSLKTDGTSKALLHTPVPVSMSDFGMEISGFSEYASDNSCLANLLETKIAFLFNVEVASLNQYIPAIAELISDDNVALASFDDCKLELTLKEFRLAFTSNLKLITVFDIGECEVELGKFKYTNALIGYSDVDEIGLRVSVTNKISCDLANLDAELSGTQELTVGYPYSGLWFNGVAAFDVKWWILHADFDVAGDAMVGVYMNSHDELQFSFIIRGTNNRGDYSGFNISITKASGFNIHSY